MAISEMLKLKLVGINASQDEILNCLHSTGAVEITSTEETVGLERISSDKSEIKNKKERIVQALSVIAEKCKLAKADGGEKDGFAVSYDEFMNASSQEDHVFEVCDKVKALNEEIFAIRAEISALKGEREYLEPYLKMQEKFSDFQSTQFTVCKLGTVENKNLQKFLSRFEESAYCEVKTVSEGERHTAVCIIYHFSVREEVERILTECAFMRCIHTFDKTALEESERLKNELQQKSQRVIECENQIVALASEVKLLKILSDYYSFELEKKDASDNFERTKNTFYLTAYLPKEAKQKVEDTLSAFVGQIYTEYQELKEGDFAPTLMKNNKVVSNFEFVTNLYSVPQYLEFDPNMIMGIFFSIFLGFITADAGYGLLMIVGGLLFNARSKRKTGINKLANILIMAGIPTVLFGIGFDSWLGLPLLRSLNVIQTPFMPDPVSHTSILAGISIPTLLLIALGMGVIHIMTSLLVLAWTHFRKGRIIDGICDGVTWAIFLAGLLLFVMDEIGTIQGADNVAIGLLIGGVAVGAITAGRHVKGFGKFTKAFGAVYGLINYMSDILSYARLYGLMLSGAKIAEIFSQQLAVPMLQNPGGIVGVIACVIIMIVGHLFNIAMSLLGAFIHDARLQYVEFFSHFYTGDGELFTPLGSKLEHVYLQR